MQKLKVTLVVIGLLSIGFVGGFLTNRHLVGKKLHHFRQLERGQDFGDHFLKRIEASPAKEAELLPILEDYGPRFRELGRLHQQERAAIADSLFQELSPLLTAEQQEHGQRWKRFLERGPDKKRKKLKK